METDEMKQKWQQMETALAEQKLINEKLVRDMITYKSKKSINRPIWREVLGIVLALGMAAYLVLFYHSSMVKLYSHVPPGTPALPINFCSLKYLWRPLSYLP